MVVGVSAAVGEVEDDFSGDRVVGYGFDGGGEEEVVAWEAAHDGVDVGFGAEGEGFPYGTGGEGV